jgi:hypothetical protein
MSYVKVALIPQPLLPQEKGSRSLSPLGEGFRERAFQVYVSNKMLYSSWFCYAVHLDPPKSLLKTRKTIIFPLLGN